MDEEDEQNSQPKMIITHIADRIRSALPFGRVNATQVDTPAENSTPSVGGAASSALAGLTGFAGKLGGALVGAAGDAVIQTGRNAIAGVTAQFSPKNILQNFAAQGPFSAALVNRLFPNTLKPDDDRNPVVETLQQILAKLDAIGPVGRATPLPLIDYSPKLDVLISGIQELKQISNNRAAPIALSSGQSGICTCIEELREFLLPLADLREIKAQLTDNNRLLKAITFQQTPTPSAAIVEATQSTNPLAIIRRPTVAEQREVKSPDLNTGEPAPTVLLQSMDSRLERIAEILTEQQNLLANAAREKDSSGDTDLAKGQAEGFDRDDYGSGDSSPTESIPKESEPKNGGGTGLFSLLRRGGGFLKSLGTKAGRRGIITGVTNAAKGLFRGGIGKVLAGGLGIGGVLGIGRAASAAATSGVVKAGVGAALKTGAKSLARFIPGVGLAVGAGIVGSQLANRQYGAAALSTLSAGASLIPGVGTSASIGLGVLSDVVASRESAANKLKAAQAGASQQGASQQTEPASGPLEITIRPPPQEQNNSPSVTAVLAPFSLSQIVHTQLFSYLGGGRPGYGF